MGDGPAGDAEVGEARSAVLADQHIGGLDVAVDDPGPVCGLDGARELDPGPEHLLDREPILARAHREVRRRVVLHHQVGATIAGLLGPEHLDDVGMVGELGHRVGLFDELPTDRRREAIALEHLDGNVHPRRLLLVEIDVGIAAGPERLDVHQPGDVRRRRRRAHSSTS